MKCTEPDRQKKAAISRIDDCLITAAYKFQASDLPNFYVTESMEQVFLDALVSLHEEGCNPITLCWALRLGQATVGKKVGAIPTAKKSRALASSADRLADEIERVEESGVMWVINGEETSQPERERGVVEFDKIVDIEQGLPHLDLERLLRKKADMYRMWAKLASKGVRPRSATMLKKLEYLFPAMYVQRVTGNSCHEKLMELFSTIRISVDKSQLRRELTQLCKSYTWTYWSIVSMLESVNDRWDCFLVQGPVQEGMTQSVVFVLADPRRTGYWSWLSRASSAFVRPPRTAPHRFLKAAVDTQEFIGSNLFWKRGSFFSSRASISPLTRADAVVKRTQ